MNRKVLIFLLAGILFGLVGSQWYSSVVKQPVSSIQNKATEAKNETTTSTEQGKQSEIPKYVYDVLNHVNTYHEPMQGYVGGRKFMNFEGKLPKKTSNNVKINYREWDVHPKVRGKNRGAERLVTGNDRSAWYTKDHYKSFIRIP